MLNRFLGFSGIVVLLLLVVSHIGRAAPVDEGDALVRQQDPGALVTSLSASDHHTCALRSDGTIQCWGNDSNDEASPPDGTFLQVSAGDQHTCGLKSDGTVQCWGDNASDRADAPDGIFLQVSAGHQHTCAIQRDGTVLCWGDDSNGQASPPDGSFLQVSAGRQHTCGLKSDGTVQCWGNLKPFEILQPSGTFLQISAGDEHTCGIRSDGTIECWGGNVLSEASPPDGTFLQVGVGQEHACGIREDGTVECWGNDDAGQASPPDGTFLQVSAGTRHSCGVRSDGTITCWGDDSDGRAPTRKTGPFTRRSISAGQGHTCSVRPDGSVGCWGQNQYGQASPPDGSFVQVSAGKDHSCGVKSDRTLTCWGNNSYGQATPPSGTYVQVAAGFYFSCARRIEGALDCWGWNGYGQTDVPLDLGSVLQVSAGGGHTCAVSVGSELRCWGWNVYGQTDFPASLGPVAQVSAGDTHTCVRTIDSAAHCWGDDTYGQQRVPPSLAGTSSISTGGKHTCARGTNGFLHCWGDDTHGQTSIPPGTDPVTQLSAGGEHTCAVLPGDFLRCWGQNQDAQAPAITIETLTLSEGVTGTAYSQEVNIDSAPYNPVDLLFTLSQGELPPGLQLSENGQLSGTPTASGSYAFSIRVTDRNGFEDSRSYTLVINDPPVADAGSDQTLFVGRTARLDGNGSHDPDGHTPLSYRWTQTGGPSVALSDSTVGSPTFTSPAAPAQLNFTLTVTDRRGLASEPDSVTIHVIDQTIEGLEATSSNPTVLGRTTHFTATVTGGTNVEYHWDFGDGMTGEGRTTSHVYPEIGTYIATVTARNQESELMATTSVVVTNQPPVAHAGPDQTAFVAATVRLDGRASRDPDAHAPLSYRWVQTGGPRVALSNPAALRPTFAAPNRPAVITFSLTVNDGRQLTSLSPDTITIRVIDRPITGLQARSSTPVVLGQTTHFTATIEAGSNVEYLWEFGDGKRASGRSVNYIYSEPGTYTTTLTARNSRGRVTAIVPVNVVLHNWLPFMSNRTTPRPPDLVITDLRVTNRGVALVITNRGGGAVNQPFWVDVYLDPDPAPTGVNEIWPELAPAGLLWGVTEPLAPGASLVLRIGDRYYVPTESRLPDSIAAGTVIYAQVDSSNMSTGYGTVLEGHELQDSTYNNIAGPVIAPRTVLVASEWWAESQQRSLTQLPVRR